MPQYFPEGLTPQTTITLELLKTAQREQLVLEAPAVFCDEAHNLLVDLGCAMGFMARKDAARELQDGGGREIAVLSRVGKRVCFHVTGFLSDGTPVLSRASAQAAALQHILTEHRPGDILPAVVVNSAPFGAFCDIGCGVTALLSLKNISISRVWHSAERFRTGQEILVILQSADASTGRITITHKELLGTWAQNVADVTVGQTRIGIVRSVESYGTFIELKPNLSGLSDRTKGLCEGDAVSVYIKAIQKDAIKIKLNVIATLDRQQLVPQPIRYYYKEGHIDLFQYGPDSHMKCRTIF